MMIDDAMRAAFVLERSFTRTGTYRIALFKTPSSVLYEIVGILLDLGANPKFTNNEGVAPLHIACARGESTLPPLIQLLERGANADIEDTRTEVRYIMQLFSVLKLTHITRCYHGQLVHPRWEPFIFLTPRLT